MLSIYTDSISIVKLVGRTYHQIAKHDPDLARQMRRAVSSITLNIAEGAAMTGGNQRQRYITALGSAKETRACFDIAEALDYIPPMSDEDVQHFRKVIGVLVRNIWR